MKEQYHEPNCNYLNELTTYQIKQQFSIN